MGKITMIELKQIGYHRRESGSMTTCMHGTKPNLTCDCCDKVVRTTFGYEKDYPINSDVSLCYECGQEINNGTV